VHFGGASEEGEAIGVRCDKIVRMGGPREFIARDYFLDERGSVGKRKDLEIAFAGEDDGEEAAVW
jgi:hypothetical protein